MIEHNKVIKSDKKTIFNSDDFEYNLFYSSGSEVQLLMDDVLYKYLMQCNENTFQTLVKLYGIDNVKRVANNIRIKHGYEIYKILKTKYLDKFEEKG